ncbi:MAG: tetratricopeptide repeat protein [Methanolinea sp.]|jgi:tetratricopeptide (TPR) repeat protein|nr:tetratricopeptide repeat protein [Methanolinea sp.]
MHVTKKYSCSLILMLALILLLAVPASAQTAGVYMVKGDELSDEGKYEEAIAQYDQAIAFEPKAAPAWCGKGLALYNLTRYDEALDAFDQAIAINPNYAKAQYGRGVALYELGRYDDAIAAYDIAFKIYPEYGYLIYYGKAQAYAAKGDFTQAVPLFEQALTLQPGYAGVWVEKGDAMAASGDSQGALAAYQKALSLEPGFALAEAGVAAAQANLTGSVVVTTAIPQATDTQAPVKTTVPTTAPATTRTRAPISAWTCGAGLLVAVGLALHRRH